jgi:hypothetical protein
MSAKGKFAQKQTLQLVRPSFANRYLMNAMLGAAWAVAIVMGWCHHLCDTPIYDSCPGTTRFFGACLCKAQCHRTRNVKLARRLQTWWEGKTSAQHYRWQCHLRLTCQAEGGAVPVHAEAASGCGTQRAWYAERCLRCRRLRERSERARAQWVSACETRTRRNSMSHAYGCLCRRCLPTAHDRSAVCRCLCLSNWLAACHQSTT